MKFTQWRSVIKNEQTEKKKRLERTGKYTWSFIWHHLLKFHTSGISKISIIHFLNCLLTLWVSQCKRKETVALNGMWQGKASRVSANRVMLTDAKPTDPSTDGSWEGTQAVWPLSLLHLQLQACVLEGLYFHHQISSLAFHYPSYMSIVSYPGSWFFSF